MSGEIEIPGLYISSSVKEVVRVMTGLELNEIKFLSEDGGAVDEQITGLLIMAGEFNILLSLGMPRDTAVMLAVYMTGIEKSQLSDYELNDCVAELTNMIAGQLKTQLAAGGSHFKNLPPIVVNGNDYDIVHKSKVENKCKRFRAGSMDFVFKAHYLNS